MHGIFILEYLKDGAKEIAYLSELAWHMANPRFEHQHPI